MARRWFELLNTKLLMIKRGFTLKNVWKCPKKLWTCDKCTTLVLLHFLFWFHIDECYYLCSFWTAELEINKKTHESGVPESFCVKKNVLPLYTSSPFTYCLREREWCSRMWTQTPEKCDKRGLLLKSLSLEEKKTSEMNKAKETYQTV